MTLDEYREAAQKAEAAAMAAETDNAPNAARLRREADMMQRAYERQKELAE